MRGKMRGEGGVKSEKGFGVGAGSLAAGGDRLRNQCAQWPGKDTFCKGCGTAGDREGRPYA